MQSMQVMIFSPTFAHSFTQKKCCTCRSTEFPSSNKSIPTFWSHLLQSMQKYIGPFLTLHFFKKFAKRNWKNDIPMKWKARRQKHTWKYKGKNGVGGIKISLPRDKWGFLSLIFLQFLPSLLMRTKKEKLTINPFTSLKSPLVWPTHHGISALLAYNENKGDQKILDR